MNAPCAVAMVDRLDGGLRAALIERRGAVPLAVADPSRVRALVTSGTIGAGWAIAYHNRRPLADCAHVYHGTAEALAAWADAPIVTATPPGWSPPIVTGAVLDALGPDGILVNVGRGAAVDEAVLVARLADGRLLAAGLDVFADEPRVLPALASSDRVVLSPHQGSATSPARAAMTAAVLAAVAGLDAEQ